MKKRIRILAIVLSLAMMVTIGPQTALAKDVGVGKAEAGKTEIGKMDAKAIFSQLQSQFDRIYGDGTQLRKKMKNKTPYKEGEAIVLMKNPAAAAGKMASKSQLSARLPEGVTLKKSIRFEGSDTGSAELRAAGLTADAAALTQNDLVILLVKSDTLSTAALVAKLKKQKNVLIAQPNYRYQPSALTNDEYASQQWGLQNNWHHPAIGGDVNPTPLWSALPAGSDKVVALIDTGVDYEHPDLKNVMWNNPYPSKLQGKHGYNFFMENSDPMDTEGHGTHVAGIIAAEQGNGIGVAGLDGGAKIMALCVEFSDMEILEAYEYIYKARTLGVPVVAVNNSWGPAYNNDYEDPILTAVVNKVGDKGVLSVFAAGNNAYESVPMAASSPYQISVAASNAEGELVDFSDYGKWVDIAAPGDSILSTVSYPNYNPVLYSGAAMAAINDVYEDFEGGSLGNLTHLESIQGDWTTGSAITAVTSEDSFEADGGSHALKWSIPDANRGETYHLIVPYTSAANPNPVYGNFSFRIAEAPDSELDDISLIDFIPNLILFSDAKLKANGGLPERYSSGNLLLNALLGLEEYQGGYIDGAAESWNPDIGLRLQSGATKAEPHAMVISFVPNVAGKYVFYMDDIGISKPIADKNVLGKYAFYSGTSMAAPFVTASVALVSAANPSWTAKQVAAAVKGMSVPSPAFTGKVISNGILNLAKYNHATPFIESVKVGANGTVILDGTFFGSAKGSGSLTANGADITPLSWGDNTIRLPGGGLINHKVDFALTTGDGGKTKISAYVVDGKSSYTTEGAMKLYEGGSFTTDGKSLYYVRDGIFYLQMPPQEIEEAEDPEDEEDPLDEYDEDEEAVDDSMVAPSYLWQPSAKMDKKTMFPDATEWELKQGKLSFESECPYMNGRFYGIAVLKAGGTACYALVSYDPVKNRWSRVADRPGAERKAPIDKVFDRLRYSSLASYNNKLYFMGGLDETAKTTSNAVRIFDPKTKKWSNGPSLPENRFMAVGRQVGNRLVLSLGGDGSADETRVPAPLIFNGNRWTVGTAIANPYQPLFLDVDTSASDPNAVEGFDPWSGGTYYYRNFPYYKAAVGLVKNGLIYSGLAAPGLGDTFTYRPDTNQYAASAYQLTAETSGALADGIAVGGTFWVVGESESYSDSYDYDDMEDGNGSLLWSIHVSSGLVKISGQHKGGKVVGHGRHLPGQQVTLKAVPKKGYYLTKFVVAGKSIKVKYDGATTSILVRKNTKATATFAKYKTKVTLNRTEVSLRPERSVQLKATVTGARTKAKGVTWKSSNTKYAVVSKTGKVTTKKAGLGHAVLITAMAKDGSKVVGKSTIKIFTRRASRIKLSATATSLKVGKSLQIRASVSPTKGTLKAVKWTVSDKRFAKISATGKLTAKAKGRGKYVTVTAKAMDGSGKRATIRIKIK